VTRVLFFSQLAKIMEHEVRYDLVNYLALFAIIMIRGLQKE